jgi:DNA-binding ferritin-like protein
MKSGARVVHKAATCSWTQSATRQAFLLSPCHIRSDTLTATQIFRGWPPAASLQLDMREYHWNCGHYREYHWICEHSRISLKLRTLFTNSTESADIIHEFHWNCRHSRISLKLRTLFANSTQIADIFREFHWNCRHSLISTKLRTLFENFAKIAGIIRENQWNCGYHSRIPLKSGTLVANIAHVPEITHSRL